MILFLFLDDLRVFIEMGFLFLLSL